MARSKRLWWTAAVGAFLALVFEAAVWFLPQLLRGIREPACAIQFCLVLGTVTDTACVTVEYQHSPGGTADLYLYPDQPPQRQGTLAQRQAYIANYQAGFEYPCYYQGNKTVATFTPPRRFNGLYLSFLIAIALLAILALALYMALQMPPHKALVVRQLAPIVVPAPKAVSSVPQPISNSIAEALRQTDENLKKRIIKLATKLENERDARLDLEQRLSQSLEAAAASSDLQGPRGRNSRGSTASPLGRQNGAV